MWSRLLARAIPLSPTSFGFPKPLSPILHIGGPCLTTSFEDPIADGGIGGEDDPFGVPDRYYKQLPPGVPRGVDVVVPAAEATGSNAAYAVLALDGCGVEASKPLVVASLACLRNSYAAVHAAFRWANAQPGYAQGQCACHFMIDILAKCRRFDAARALLDEMHHASTASPAAILFLVRCHCAARDVAGTVTAFRALPSFGFHTGINEFHGLLNALCRYKNVHDAKNSLISWQKEFPFEIKSFNIVLNRWCNIIYSMREAKRFWNSMERKGIARDVLSYRSMISCFSKADSLNSMMKLINRMNEADIALDQKVCNAIVFALAKGRCVKEAKMLVRSMEEKQVAQDTATFNSLISPLCKACRF